MKISLGENFSFKIHKEGNKFILLFAISTIFLFALNSGLGMIGFYTTIFCIAFFRDPERIIPKDETLVVSAGDGIVTFVGEVEPNAELKDSFDGKKMMKISVFLSVFNVHVNRMPVKGKIVESKYVPGKFFNASLEKSSLENERHALLIETDNGNKVGCVQIAGLIAKRIVCDAKIGDSFTMGQRYGIIRFGSRMDVYLPVDSYECLVSVGQTVIGGETVMAKQK